MLMLPVPVISLPFKSKPPPSCGVVSATMSATPNDKLPAPSVFKTSFAFPSAVGCDNPSRITFPAPLGVIAMLPLEAETIEFPLTSKSPPN